MSESARQGQPAEEHESCQSLPASPTPDLCADCQSLDLGSKFEQSDSRYRSRWDFLLSDEAGFQDWFTLVADLGSRLTSEAATNCQLCHFLWSSRTADSPSEQYRIIAVPIFVVLRFVRVERITFPKNLPGGHQCTAMLVVPLEYGPAPSPVRWESSRAIFRTTKNDDVIITAKPIRSFVDFSAISSWVQFCQTHHVGIPCSKRFRHMREATFDATISGFKLIDCQDGKVVPSTPEVEYVALSYVWGSPSAGHSAATQGAWPRVVHDAVTATKQLGFRYLWVDRYCIDQENQEEKHAQIAKMDVIYRQAQLTIIAAAGNDATHGLPGVNSPRSSALKSIAIGNSEYFAGPPDAYDVLRQSAWWSRGWTYQEGVLSRRRLVFTEEQVYFECNSMTCFEGIESRIQLLHEMSNRWSRDWLIPGIIDGRDHFHPYHETNVGVSQQENSLFSHLQNYSAKKLTYDTDNLDAFKGILHSFKAQTFFGLIIPSKHTRTRFRRSGRASDDSVALAMAGWRHPPPITDSGSRGWLIERVDSLPSWSWAGWRGRISGHMTIEYSRSVVGNTPDSSSTYSYNSAWESIALRDMKGNALESLEDMVDSFEDLSKYFQAQLWITAAAAVWSKPSTSIHAVPNRHHSLQLVASADRERYDFLCDLSIPISSPEAFIQDLRSGLIVMIELLQARAMANFLVIRDSGKRLGDGTVVWERVGLCLAVPEKYREYYMSYAYLGLDHMSPLIKAANKEYCIG